MGQSISEFVLGKTESPSTTEQVPEPTSTNELGPSSSPLSVSSEEDLMVSNASVGTPGSSPETQQISSFASEPALGTTSTLESLKIVDFIKEINQPNDWVGENFIDTSYHEEERIKQSITEHLPYVNITRVCVVKNNFLRGMYELKRAEYKSRYGTKAVRELTLFHATDANNVDSIIKDNLDWRRVYRSKYGMGVSFSWDPDYGNFHCTPQNGFDRVFIVASVLVCQETEGYRGMEMPPENFDTAVGNNHLVYVKFYDNEFLPEYLAFYDSPHRPRSKYWVNRH